MKLFTIGFTKKSAQDFFTRLGASGARRVVDVRLNNRSQLAGFSKRNDLQFFLRELCDMDYAHAPELAPTKDILDEYKKGYKKNRGAWSVYERKFFDLMREREIEKKVDPALIADGCLLCSEDKPHHCHRRLVAEYLKEHWGDVDIEHLE